MIHLGKTIRRMRTERGLSQQKLAEDAGLTASFLSLVENDRRQPSLTVLSRLASALKIPEDVIIWDAVELPPKLSHADRRMCEMAKLIVRRFIETSDGPAHKNDSRS